MQTNGRVSIVHLLVDYTKEREIPLYFEEVTFFKLVNEYAKGMMSISEDDDSIIFIYRPEGESVLTEDFYPLAERKQRVR